MGGRKPNYGERSKEGSGGGGWLGQSLEMMLLFWQLVASPGGPAYPCPFLEPFPSVSSHAHWPPTSEFFIYLSTSSAYPCLPTLLSFPCGAR